MTKIVKTGRVGVNAEDIRDAVEEAGHLGFRDYTILIMVEAHDNANATSSVYITHGHPAGGVLKL